MKKVFRAFLLSRQRLGCRWAVHKDPVTWSVLTCMRSLRITDDRPRFTLVLFCEPGDSGFEVFRLELSVKKVPTKWSQKVGGEGLKVPNRSRYVCTLRIAFLWNIKFNLSRIVYRALKFTWDLMMCKLEHGKKRCDLILSLRQISVWHLMRHTERNT